MCLFRKKRPLKKYYLGNKKMSYSEKDFEKVYSLLNDAPWLCQREPQLYELLFDLAKKEDERGLLSELLRIVVYIDDNDSRKYIKQIADYIINNWRCSDSDTIIVGGKKGNKVDGADVFLYGLRNAMGWREGCFRNTYKNIQNIPNLKNVIVADDFTGTGQRLDGVLRDMESQKLGVKIRFVSIAFMDTVAKTLYPDIFHYDYYAPVLIKPGFRHADKKKLDLMCSLESYLAPTWRDLSLAEYHLGFKESGALYWNIQYRVPNNVYPVFWWGLKADGTIFNSIMGEQ